MQQAAIGDCLDPFPFDQYGLTAAEVDVGWRQIADALVIAQVIDGFELPAGGDRYSGKQILPTD